MSTCINVYLTSYCHLPSCLFILNLMAFYTLSTHLWYTILIQLYSISSAPVTPRCLHPSHSITFYICIYISSQWACMPCWFFLFVLLNCYWFNFRHILLLLLSLGKGFFFKKQKNKPAFASGLTINNLHVEFSFHK